MRLKRTLSIIGILMAIAATAALAIMPASAQTTGVIKVVNGVDSVKPFVSPLGSATVQVDDADLNVLTNASQTLASTAFTAGTSVFFTLTNSFSTPAGDEISGTPTVKSVSGTNGVTAANIVVGVFNPKTARITITTDINTNATITLDYKVASKQTTTAKVTSPSDTTGITLTLTETGVNTGKFTGKFNINGTASSTVTNDILAVAGQAVTVSYTDASPAGTRTSSITVEDSKPIGVLVSPANKSFTTSVTPKLIVDFTDGNSGVSEGTIAFTLVSAINPAGTDKKAAVTVSAPTTSAITQGFRGEVTLSSATTLFDNTTTQITWRANAADKAGNTATTDADAATTAVAEAFTFIIDKSGPNFAGATSALAGAWYDDAKGVVVTKSTQSKDTSIGIQLPNILPTIGTKEDLNPGTVSTADFRIKNLKKADNSVVGGAVGDSDPGITPTAVLVPTKATNWIFLTVPAMAPDAAPTVILQSTAGGISDAAGNSTSSGSVLTTDNQAPIVTATLNRSLHTSNATLTITTNEGTGTPTVTANGTAQVVTLTGTNQYSSTITPGKGVYSIRVTASDFKGNTRILGSTTPATTFPKTGDIALYIDNTLPAPSVTVNNVTAAGATVETSVPFFITASYTAEGTEYGLTAGATVALDTSATAIATDLDIHNTVTISTITLDGNSILGLLDTQDNVTFDFALNAITTGAHELVIIAKDAAGNTTSTGTINFTVVARKPYKIAMTSGWNLISFPGKPANTDINSVLPSTHPATDVLSFQNGQWLSASRLADRTWDGTLSTVDGNHAYWVNTTSGQAVEALLALPPVGTAASPQSIPVTAGWNLVPVVDLSQTAQGTADGADADTLPDDTKTGQSYFTSITWSIAYTYNASTRTWTRIQNTTGGGNVSNGQGVWVWAEKAGTLIP